MKLRLPGMRGAGTADSAYPPQDPERARRLAWEVERLTEALNQRDQALNEAQERAQAYLDIVGVMVVMLNRKGNVILANRKACEVLGCDPERQCLGVNWFERFIPETERVATWAVFLRLMNGKEESHAFHENQVLTCTGQIRLIAWHNTLLRGRDGAILGTLSAGEDITEARQVQESLRHGKERLRLAQEIAHIGTYEWHIQTGEMIWTPELEALHGLPPGGYRRTMEHWLAMLHPDDLEGARRMIDTALAATGLVEGEWRVLWPDGSLHWLAGRGQMYRDAEGRPLRMVGVNIDITEEKNLREEQLRLQAQLRQSQKMEALGQLTGGIAHDFNNILTSVLGFARLARRRQAAAADDKLAEYLDEIIAAGERARDLVAKMLTFGRGQHGREGGRLAPLPLAREAVKMLAASIPASIRIDTHFQEDTPEIALDPVAFQQILVNLVINARDAVGDKGHVTVSLTACALKGESCAACHEDCGGEFVELAVADTGAGIAPEILPRIFDPFFTTKAAGKGSGMGLAVVHGLVHGAGGHFRVDSTPGAGTTFRVYLPIARPADGAAPAPASVFAPIQGRSRRGRVLVVDDEPAILRLLGVVLEAEGWQVSAFDRPLAALAAFRAEPGAFSAVITDQAMPDMTGMELIQALHGPRPELPALLCTGYSERLDEAAALKLGASRFFLKPVDSDVLLAALDGLTAPRPPNPPRSDPA